MLGDPEPKPWIVMISPAAMAPCICDAAFTIEPISGGTSRDGVTNIVTGIVMFPLGALIWRLSWYSPGSHWLTGTGPMAVESRAKARETLAGVREGNAKFVAYTRDDFHVNGNGT